MSHGHTRIPTKGRCIYCGRADVRLTDEHFLPLSLGGQHVIEKASCHSCADITKKFEQLVARYMRRPYAFHLSHNSSELIHNVHTEVHLVYAHVIVSLFVID